MHRKLVGSGNGLAMTLRDITQSKKHESELARIANEDALTGLPNRHFLMHALPQMLQSVQASNGVLALLFLDPGGFKNVSDTLGHAVGDEVLKFMAACLRSVIRPSDHAARLGGDEFTIILEPVSTEADAAIVAERIVDAFRHPFALSGGDSSLGGRSAYACPHHSMAEMQRSCSSMLTPRCIHQRRMAKAAMFSIHQPSQQISRIHCEMEIEMDVVPG